MAQWGRASAAATAVSLAILTMMPALEVRADLLGGATDPIVDTTTEVIDDTVDTTETVIDETVGETGTVLDEPVDDLTDVVDTTSDTLTDTVDSETGVVTDTGEDTTDPVTDAGDPVAADEPVSGTDSDPTTTTDSDESVAAAAALEQNPVTDVETSEPEQAVTVGGATEPTPTRAELLDADALTVLAVVGGFRDPAVLEAASVGPIADPSLYGRLLGWLTAAGTGLLGLLAGPLLALEILLRALLSAGSGMVAPASLLASYLLRLLWEGRDATST